MSEDAFPLQSLPISHAIELIATIEDHFQATNRLNFQLEQQITNQIENRRKEIETRKERTERIMEMINQLTIYVEASQREVDAVGLKVKRDVERSSEQMAREIKLPVPKFNFAYIMNDPQQFSTLSERLSEAQQNLARKKVQRDDEIRTLKIRISLAQIQLKQLKTRAKKV